MRLSSFGPGVYLTNQGWMAEDARLRGHHFMNYVVTQFFCSRFLDTGRSDLSVPQSRGVLLGLRLGYPQGNQSGTALLEEGTAAGLPRKCKENGRVSRYWTPPPVDRPNSRRSDTKALI